MARWLDHGVTPPAPLPEDTDEALAYLTHVLGHTCYERWTLAKIKRAFSSLGTAKVEMRSVFDLLLDHTEVVEWWESGRLRTAATDNAPSPQDTLNRLLRTYRRRFRHWEPIQVQASDSGDHQRWVAAIDPQHVRTLVAWLSRSGRFVNQEASTNTLATFDDCQAFSLFLRDRASRSRHTLRAYAADLRRLISWCRDRQIGPLSNLTRNDLLAYRDSLCVARISISDQGQQRVVAPSERTQARALAVVASLYQYWFDTGYLIANPASGLVTGTQARNEFSPKRFLSPTALNACDAWLDTPIEGKTELALLRRRAIWVLYRYGGIRLAELAWHVDTNLPRVVVEDDGKWTLYVHGKGNKDRAIPLPDVAANALTTYRIARGLTAQPAAHEVAPLIHGFKGGALQESGLYSEVKAIFEEVATTLRPNDGALASLLEAASPHWLRHAYAKALVVDHQVPLPVAQALLGHASVQTTASYSKTDLAQLRNFVETSFTNGGK
ncbi:tyrosine-type recombinase/integrase [Herbaspirillum sp. DW155]|uniref:tyrosine-type recombinase/integrase n=1 Tax=Herbaspirillum sp. DW155 TaxID=3095609 RepID=UPI00308AAE56|nr:tyrosine-type recombinase/integrase [Herbaspirillum sp. DW155]